MMSFSVKHYYKGISLFTKTCILIFSVVYIVHKINSSHLLDYFTNEQFQWSFFILALSLVILNWGIEAYKWQFLIQKIEKISFVKSFQSILSGVTIGVFTPNRVGEFAGRVFYLDAANKIQATLISFVGSAFQLLVTILLGFIGAFYMALHDNMAKQVLSDIITSNYFFLFLLLVVMLFVLWFVFKARIKNKYRQYLEVLYSYTRKELFTVFCLSLFRYFIFSIQYYFILKCFQIDLSILLSFHLIALTFLVSSIIPSFAFSEMLVRGASAMYFFSLYVPDTSLVLASSLMVWLINLALPAIVGAFFIGKLKFFKA